MFIENITNKYNPNFQITGTTTYILVVPIRNTFKMLQKRTFYQHDEQSFVKKAKLSVQDLKDILSDSDSDWEFTIENDRLSEENINNIDCLLRPSNISKNDNIHNQTTNRTNDIINKPILSQVPMLQLDKDKSSIINDPTKFSHINRKSAVHNSIWDSRSPFKPISISEEDLTESDDDVHLCKEVNEIDEDYQDIDVDNEAILNTIQVNNSSSEDLHKSLQQEITEKCDEIHGMAVPNTADPTFNDSSESVESVTIYIPDIINGTSGK